MQASPKYIFKKAWAMKLFPSHHRLNEFLE